MLLKKINMKNVDLKSNMTYITIQSVCLSVHEPLFYEKPSEIFFYLLKS